ncbi:UNVERIFIED_CONTAM: hypothetical protein Sradi_0280800 [Sesamum radiatum]|uniref:Uncharacterized protein n=1 Tax=Sesamum radiatum TaxID=300843 RepID=A0AAW2W189_SESRA
MKDFPSCFGESGVQVADSSSTSTNRAAAQNLVTCVYQYQSQGFSGFITVTWIKYLMGQGLSIGVENSSKESICKVDIKPWLFSKRKGFKNLVLDSTIVDVQWDLSCAKFGSGPEPLEGFYLAVSLNQELCLLLGDLEHEACKRSIRSQSLLFKGQLLLLKENTSLGRDCTVQRRSFVTRDSYMT